MRGKDVGRSPRFPEFYSCICIRFLQQISEKNPFWLLLGEANGNHFEIEHSGKKINKYTIYLLFFFKKPCPREKRFYRSFNLWEFYQNLTHLVKGNPQLQPTAATLSHRRQGRNRDALVQFTAKGHRLAQNVRPGHNTGKSRSPTYLTTVYLNCFYLVHHVQPSLPNYKPYSKVKKKKKIQLEEAEQTSNQTQGREFENIRL